MPSFSNTAFANFFKRILQIDQSSNTGVDGTVRNIQTGDGATTSLWMSASKLWARPKDTDTTQAFMVADQSGSQVFAVDTTNNKVLLGTSPINQQTKEFGIYDLSPTAGYHYPLVAHQMFIPTSATAFAGDNDWGNDPEPATSLDVSGLTQQENVIAVYWLVPASITLLSVKALVACDDSDAATINVHLFSYNRQSTTGDLADGTKQASGNTTCTNAQIKEITCTLDSATIASGRTVVAFVENATGTDDVSVQMNVQYFINI